MKAGGRRVQKMGMREAGVLFPGRLHLIGLEADARPADFEAFADLGQALLHAERGLEQLNRVHALLPGCGSCSPNRTWLVGSRECAAYMSRQKADQGQVLPA